jgi:hypothetical protein
MTTELPDSAAAWREFCDRMAAVGERLLADGFPQAEPDRAEGYRHLANQVACWLTFAVGHTDAQRPMLFRSSDPTYQWGGPNADQVARRAPITGDGTYRLRGNMGACEEFVLQIKTGATQSGGADVALETSASQLGLGPGDDIDILLSQQDERQERQGRRLPLDPAASFLHIRDYYFAWQPREPATFVLERLDMPADPPPAFTVEDLRALLDGAAHEIEHSIDFWNRYQENLRGKHGVNAFGEPAPVPRGVQDVLYSHAFVALRDDQAMLVSFDSAPDESWDFQLYSRHWYEALDFRYRSSTTNHRLAARGADGLVHAVITARDPGWPNWLDTQGRAEVLATLRWWHPRATPRVSYEILSVDQLDDRLPSDVARIDAATRDEEIRNRAAHAAWRYRT